MKTETKLKRAREKRNALVLAEAELKQKEVEAEKKSRATELAELNKNIQPKLKRSAKLRSRFLELIEQSKQVVARDLTPSWLCLHTEAEKAQQSLRAFCRQNGLPEPRHSNGFRELSRAAPWVPIPVTETIDTTTGELKHSSHPAYRTFQDAFSTLWAELESLPKELM